MRRNLGEAGVPVRCAPIASSLVTKSISGKEADGKAKRRIDPEMIGVVAVLVARRDLINALPDHLNQGVSGMNG